MVESHRKRVLITALGTMNCTTLVKELRKIPEDFYIIGADINPSCCIYTSTEVDEFYQFPKATDDREQYFTFVKDFCITHRISIYFCVVDEEVETMALHRDELSKIGVALCVANTDAVVICHNKDKFADWCEANMPEYSIKRFRCFESVRAQDFPLFVKPIEGRASIGCKRINDMYELAPYKEQWNKYVIQEYIVGDVLAADVVRCKTTGLILVCQRKELLRNSNGCGVAIQIVNNPEVEIACRKIALLLDLNGVVNVEFFISGNDIRVIEVNPRIPAGVAFSCMAGLNIAKLALDIAVGLPIVDHPHIRVGSFFAKRYETYEIKTDNS